MKAVIVNSTKKHIASKSVQKFISEVCAYFVEQNVRNATKLKSKSEISVVFLSPTEIKKLNRAFRKKDKATDILSFESDDPASLGELLLCPAVLKKQAMAQKHSFELEMQYMLIHGVLHLLGYDHEASAREEKLMFRIQDKCFQNLSPVRPEKNRK